MRLIIGLIIFWISTIGYLLYINKKTKLPYVLSLPLLYTVIAITIFTAGLLNIMKLVAALICLIGLISFIYYFKKKEIDYKKLDKTNLIIIIITILYITIICQGLHVTHYDNFSHWGLIARTMLTKHHLPNFEDTVIIFKNYQPGSACFIYYVALLLGKSEGAMIIAQNYLIMSYVFSLLIFTNSKSKSNNIIRFVTIAFYVLMLLGNIKFNDLLVDTLLAAISIYSIVILYYFRDDLKKAAIYILPVSIYLFLVKNSGIVLLFLNLIGLIYIGYRNKKIKKSIIYSIIIGLISLAFFYLWSRHVSYVFGASGLSSKHSLDSTKILNELQSKGKAGIIEFISIYFKHFIDILHNIPHIYMIVINIIAIVLAFINKKSKKVILKYLLTGDLIYLFYYLVLGAMYLLSMPWNELIVLASFDRYMLTIIFIVIGLLLICYFDVLNKGITKPLICSIVLSIVIIIPIFISKERAHNLDLLIGDENYKETVIYKMDRIIKQDKKLFKKKNNNYYYLYAPETAKNDGNFLMHIAQFKLNTLDFKVIDNTDDITDQKDKEIIILIFDNTEKINSYINSNQYIELSNQIYEK